MIENDEKYEKVLKICNGIMEYCHFLVRSDMFEEAKNLKRSHDEIMTNLQIYMDKKTKEKEEELKNAAA
jgi:hypothetical protein